MVDTRGYHLSQHTIVVFQSLNGVWLFVTPWTAACQASLSFMVSQSLLKFMSIESMMLSNHLILCCPLLLLPSIFPIIRVFSVHYITIQKQIWYWHNLRMALVVKNLPENAGYIRDAGSATGSERFPGEGHSNSLQYSCLENPMDRGTWWSTVHGVTKHQICLKHWCGDGGNIIWLLLHFSILMAFSQFLKKILVPTENIPL